MDNFESLPFCWVEIGGMVEATHRGFSRSESFSRGAGSERIRPAKMFECPGPRPLNWIRDASSEPPRKRRGNGVKNPSGSPGHGPDLFFPPSEWKRTLFLIFMRRSFADRRSFRRRLDAPGEFFVRVGETGVESEAARALQNLEHYFVPSFVQADRHPVLVGA